MYVENLATDTMGEVSRVFLPQTRPAGRRELLIALAIAIVTALIAISGESFWVDEGSSAIKAMQSTVGGWWHALLWERNSNMQLPLYLLDLWAWEKVFGASERMLRLGNVPFLLLTVYGLWLAFREDRIRFRFAVLLLLANAFVWSYLNDARPYILMLAGGTLQFAAIYRLQRDPTEFRRAWAWWWLASGSLLRAPAFVGLALLDDELLQGGQAVFPEAAIELHPAGGLGHRRGVEREQVLAALHRAGDEAGALEDADVLRDGVERDVEGLGDLGDAPLPRAQPVQDRAAGVVGEGDEDVIEGHAATLTQMGECCPPQEEGS